MHRQFLMLVLLLGSLLGAEAQTTATSHIKNPSLESGVRYWTVDGLSSQSNNSFSKKAGSLYAEKWVSSGSSVGNASLKQVVTDLPAGKYKLTVAAQNLNQDNTSAQCAGACIYAGQAQTPVYTPDDYSVEFTTYSGEVEIGFVASNAKGNWLAVDNFRLFRLEDISVQEMIDTLSQLIAFAEPLLLQEMDDPSKDLLSTAISQARSLTVESNLSDLQSAFIQLEKYISRAEFAIQLYNATPGTGTAPRVSSTNHYVATGATEALVRATMSGSNIKERGVCWSTKHEPTVLDERTTDYYSLNGYIFHLTGLKPATVYYIRPYVINSTFTVAYGDEVKIITHKKGNCVGTWDNGAPDAAANARCRNAIEETIDYFNEWTGIMGFTLSGHYGADTQTADCSYGGWMRIGPNTGNQAIGTVIHETGHGVGVGTSDRWWDKNFHDWSWKGREATEMYQFLENKANNPDYYMVGDNTHGWGTSATYDWFVNGADKDKHTPLQYIGGCALLYSLFVDGLCPTSAYPNGLPGYTYNFEDSSTYYLMCKDATRGLDSGLMYEKNSLGTYKPSIAYCLNDQDEIPESAGWFIEFDPETALYRFRNVSSGRYLSHSATSMSMKKTTKPGDTEGFQLMPDRTDVKLVSNGANITTHGYWMAWNASGNKAFSAPTNSPTGNCTPAEMNVTNAATMQQWIILTKEEVAKLKPETTAIEKIQAGNSTIESNTTHIYNTMGQQVLSPISGLYIVNNKKIYIR